MNAGLCAVVISMVLCVIMYLIHATRLTNMLYSNPILKTTLEIISVLIFLTLSCVVRVYMMGEFDLDITREGLVLLCMFMAYVTARMLNQFGFITLLFLTPWSYLISTYDYEIPQLIQMAAIVAGICILSLILFAVRKRKGLRTAAMVLFVLAVIVYFYYAMYQAGLHSVYMEDYKKYIECFNKLFMFSELERYYYIAVVMAAIIGGIRLFLGEGSANTLILFAVNALCFFTVTFDLGTMYLHLLYPLLAIAAAGSLGTRPSYMDEEVQLQDNLENVQVAYNKKDVVGLSYVDDSELDRMLEDIEGSAKYSTHKRFSAARHEQEEIDSSEVPIELTMYDSALNIQAENPQPVSASAQQAEPQSEPVRVSQPEPISTAESQPVKEPQPVTETPVFTYNSEPAISTPAFVPVQEPQPVAPVYEPASEIKEEAVKPVYEPSMPVYEPIAEPEPEKKQEPVAEAPVYEPVTAEPAPEMTFEEPEVNAAAQETVFTAPALDTLAYEEPVYEETKAEIPEYGYEESKTSDEPEYYYEEEKPAVENITETPVYETATPAYEPVTQPEPEVKTESAAEPQVYEYKVEPAVEEPIFETPIFETPAFEPPAYEEPVYEEPVQQEPQKIENPFVIENPVSFNTERRNETTSNESTGFGFIQSKPMFETMASFLSGSMEKEAAPKFEMSQQDAHSFDAHLAASEIYTPIDSLDELFTNADAGLEFEEVEIVQPVSEPEPAEEVSEPVMQAPVPEEKPYNEDDELVEEPVFAHQDSVEDLFEFNTENAGTLNSAVVESLTGGMPAFDFTEAIAPVVLEQSDEEEENAEQPALQTEPEEVVVQPETVELGLDLGEDFSFGSTQSFTDFYDTMDSSSVFAGFEEPQEIETPEFTVAEPEFEMAAETAFMEPVTEISKEEAPVMPEPSEEAFVQEEPSEEAFVQEMSAAETFVPEPVIEEAVMTEPYAAEEIYAEPAVEQTVTNDSTPQQQYAEPVVETKKEEVLQPVNPFAKEDDFFDWSKFDDSAFIEQEEVVEQKIEEPVKPKVSNDFDEFVWTDDVIKQFGSGAEGNAADAMKEIAATTVPEPISEAAEEAEIKTAPPEPAEEEEAPQYQVFQSTGNFKIEEPMEEEAPQYQVFQSTGNFKFEESVEEEAPQYQVFQSTGNFKLEEPEEEAAPILKTYGEPEPVAEKVETKPVSNSKYGDFEFDLDLPDFEPFDATKR